MIGIFGVFQIFGVSRKCYANHSSKYRTKTKYWKERLESYLEEYSAETNSEIAKKILDNFSNEINNFKQVCPVEMLDKLENPISLKPRISKVV